MAHFAGLNSITWSMAEIWRFRADAQMFATLEKKAFELYLFHLNIRTFRDADKMVSNLTILNKFSSIYTFKI